MNDEADKKDPKILIHAADWHDENVEAEPMKQLIIFSLNHEWYGVDMMHIRQVIPVPTITPLPFAPSYITGIMNLMGNITSVTDPKVLFGLEQTEASSKRHIVVIEVNSVSTGVIVDDNVEAIDVPVSKIQPLVASFDPERKKWIDSQTEYEGKIIALIHVTKFVDGTRL